MKWRSSTLRKAAELQAQIEHFERALGELLRAIEVTDPLPVTGRATKASSQNGLLCYEAVNTPTVNGGSGEDLEVLDELLF